MAIFAGETVRIRAHAYDPDAATQTSLDPPPDSAEVRFWGPGRNPKTDPSVRATPDEGPFAMTYRTEEKDFVHYQSTAGWDAGRWSYEVRVAGTSYESWEYDTFTVRA